MIKHLIKMVKDKIISASQMVLFLERLKIKEYTLRSNFYIDHPIVFEFEKPTEYYKVIKNFNLKSTKEHVGSPCFIEKLEANYSGIILKTTIKENSEHSHLISKLKRDLLIDNTV